MVINYIHCNEMPEHKVLEGIMGLHTNIFGEPNDLAGRMKEKPKLRIDIAMEGERLVGYKIGYALNREQFYSWLGGVDIKYRNQGIASGIMSRQHQFIKKTDIRSFKPIKYQIWI